MSDADFIASFRFLTLYAFTILIYLPKCTFDLRDDSWITDRELLNMHMVDAW